MLIPRKKDNLKNDDDDDSLTCLLPKRDWKSYHFHPGIRTDHYGRLVGAQSCFLFLSHKSSLFHEQVACEKQKSRSGRWRGWPCPPALTAHFPPPGSQPWLTMGEILWMKFGILLLQTGIFLKPKKKG